ncbi:hypothetical protein ACQKM9_21170 [Viridibacillus sp. NPDC093762]|uniref:hypothetical protein n=1 Tax=Viridibacillus sp. NPDC093762 TaxID=3390720 RepID=UPI003D01DB39
MTTKNTLTATQQRAQFYITYGGNKPNRSVKENRLKQLEEDLLQQNIFMDELFPQKQFLVLEQIAFWLSANGICKVGTDTLEEKLGVSVRTVRNAIKAIKLTDQFVVGRLRSAKSNCGKYVIVDKKHENFKSIMREVFLLSEASIAQLNAQQNAQQKILKDIDISTFEQENKSPNLYLSLINSKQANNKYIHSFDMLEKLKEEVESQQPKTADEQRTLLLTYTDNEYQRLFFDFIQSMPYPSIVRENAYKLTLRVGSDADVKRFIAAKEVIHHISMDIEYNHFDNVVAVFTAALLNRLEYPSIRPAEQVDRHVRATKKGVFYNWLED